MAFFIRDRNRLAQVRKQRAGLVVLSAVLLPLVGCSGSSSIEANLGESGESESEKLQVVTTFVPITSFTMAVAGDRAQVTQLLPPNVGPHDYQAKPQDVQKLAEADVLIENGLGMESFLTGLIESANNADLLVADTSEGVPTSLLSAEAGHDGHDHGEENHSDEGRSDEGYSDEDSDEAFDPHIWLDPKKAIQQVENIRDALAEADPAGEAAYTANADAYIQRLQALDQAISQTLAPYADQSFVSYHNFADHFAQSYDIDIEHLVAVPEDSATPADMQRVIQSIEASDLKTLLQEPVQQDGALSVLAQEMNLQISEFDPMESGDSEALSADYYLNTMEQNLKNLEFAFAQATP